MARFRTKLLVAAAFAAVLVVILAVGFTGQRQPPDVELILVSPPELEAEPGIFYLWDAGTAEDIEVTQRCFRAEVRFSNSGPGSILFDYDGWYSLEIQKTNSTEWQVVSYASRRSAHNQIQGESAQDLTIRIPSDAARWRVSISYLRWPPPYPVQFLDFICRDLLRIRSNFGDETVYDAESPVWEISPSLSRQDDLHRSSAPW